MVFGFQLKKGEKGQHFAPPSPPPKKKGFIHENIDPVDPFHWKDVWLLLLAIFTSAAQKIRVLLNIFL